LLDSITAIGFSELVRRLKSIVEHSSVSLLEISSALGKTYRLISQYERLEANVRIKSAYERNRGEARAILRECRKEISSACSLNNSLKIVKEYNKELSLIEADQSSRPLRIILTGEIYTLIDGFANHHIEDILMSQRVSFRKTITIGWWIRRTILNPFGGVMSERRKNQYMPHGIGGYAKDTLNDAIVGKKEGYDGIIQVFPSGCMPEIVAKSVFDNFSTEEKLPVLSIIYDEMSGDAGYFTRIEAFFDMLRRRRGEG
jgi:predicted nucleotide-binding protein (sugar kinase/HSP70/actin superfamily)